MLVSCKDRTCPFCEKQRRAKHAARILSGLADLAPDGHAAVFVGTFGEDVTKQQAARVVAKFIAWLRKPPKRDVGKKHPGYQQSFPSMRPQPTLQYVATWEEQESGRLHVNIILAPWSYTHWESLRIGWEKAGGGWVTWISHVDPGATEEVLKLSVYYTKARLIKDQAVQTGKHVTYSRGWPKLPDIAPSEEFPKATMFPLKSHSAELLSFFNWKDDPQQFVQIRMNLWAETGGLRCGCWCKALDSLVIEPEDIPAYLDSLKAA